MLGDHPRLPAGATARRPARGGGLAAIVGSFIARSVGWRPGFCLRRRWSSASLLGGCQSDPHWCAGNWSVRPAAESWPSWADPGRSPPGLHPTHGSRSSARAGDADLRGRLVPGLPDLRLGLGTHSGGGPSLIAPSRRWASRRLTLFWTQSWPLGTAGTSVDGRHGPLSGADPYLGRGAAMSDPDHERHPGCAVRGATGLSRAWPAAGARRPPPPSPPWLVLGATLPETGGRKDIEVLDTNLCSAAGRLRWEIVWFGSMMLFGLWFTAAAAAAAVLGSPAWAVVAGIAVLLLVLCFARRRATSRSPGGPTSTPAEVFATSSASRWGGGLPGSPGLQSSLTVGFARSPSGRPPTWGRGRVLRPPVVVLTVSTCSASSRGAHCGLPGDHQDPAAADLRLRGVFYVSPALAPR